MGRAASSTGRGGTNYSASDGGESSDANPEDQHGYDTAEEQEIEVQASQPPGRRTRKRKVSKWPNDWIVVTELTEHGMPPEQKAVRRMKKLAGMIARQRLPLNMPSFDELTKVDKEQLFDDCVQPYLEFPDALKPTACKVIMRIVNKSWRTHKSLLVRCFVRKGLNAREKYPYIPCQEWADFVTQQQSEEAKAKSERYTKLRERHKHDHCLGTTGYAGKAEKWAQEDRELAAKGIPNPWDKFPDDRSRQFLRARGKLVISEGCAEIQWFSKSDESVSKEILEKQAALDSSGLMDTLVRDKFVLTQVLGNSEQTGRVRGVSSYHGWKYWPNCSSMYRKRKHSDVDMVAMKEELREEVMRDIFAMLRAQGVNLVLPSNNTLSSLGCSSSTSTSDVVRNLDRPGGSSCTNPVELLTEPTLCTLVSNQVEVGRGKLFPNQTELWSVPVQDGYVVVLVDFVNPEHEGFVLTLPPTAEVTTLGEALFKRVQWRKDGIVISPMVLSTKSSLGPTAVHGGSAKSILKDLVVSNDLSSQDEKMKDAPNRGNCASKEHAEGKKQTNKSKPAPAGNPLAQDDKVKGAPNRENCASKEHAEGKKQTNKSKPPLVPRAPKSDTKRDKQVGVNQKHHKAEPTKSSKSMASIWLRPNSKFKFGEPMLLANQVKKAGPGCVALHAHYMKACAENINNGIVGRLEHHHFWRDLEPMPLTVGFEDLFDLLTLDALDVGLLRVLTLCLIVVARENSFPVGLLDPDALSIKTLRSNRAYSVAYLERCLRKYAQEKFVMFAHNCGGHWIAVIIVPNWQKVLYLDSNRGMKSDLSGLKSVIDEAYGNVLPKGQEKVKLTHATKIPCPQQGLDNTCGFFAAHNLRLAMAQANLDSSEEFELNVPISLEDIREQTAMFILLQIMEQNGEFHDPNKQYDFQIWDWPS